MGYDNKPDEKPLSAEEEASVAVMKKIVADAWGKSIVINDNTDRKCVTGTFQGPISTTAKLVHGTVEIFQDTDIKAPNS